MARIPRDQGYIEHRLAGSEEPGGSLLEAQALYECPRGLTENPGNFTVNLEAGFSGAPGNTGEREGPVRVMPYVPEQMEQFLIAHERRS